MKQKKRNFWLDISIFVAFITAAFTGIFLWLIIPHQSDATFMGFNRHYWIIAHICFGLTSLAGNVVHVIWHRKWLKALRGCRIASLPPKLRANRVIDRLVWITFLSTNVLGVLNWIIPSPENNVSILVRVHVVLGMACLLGITVHLLLHWKWITSTSQRYITGRPTEYQQLSGQENI